MTDPEVKNQTPNIIIDNEPFSVLVDTPKEVDELKLKADKEDKRKLSIEEISISSPFETDNRYKYEVKRFLTNKN